MIRIALCGFILLSSAIAGGLAGTWEGSFTQGPNTIYAGFDLDVSGDRITGAAYVYGWGYSAVSDGRLEGDRFHFTVDRSDRGNMPAAKVEFSGLVQSKSMMLAMVDGGVKYETTLLRTESHVSGPISANAPPEAMAGKWKAHFVGRIGDRPKMFDRIDFDFQVVGNTISGMAHMAAWPGDCPISEGKLENGRFSFTATGRSPSSSGLPVMRFEGEIHGNQLTLKMWHFGPGGLAMDAVR